MSELWIPSDIDMDLGKAAYFQYAAGVAILNYPDNQQILPLHRRGVSVESEREEVLRYAQQRIWSGLSGIIRQSNPPERRSPLSATEDYYEEAFHYMHVIVEAAATNQSQRLEQLNPLFTSLRPLPLDHENVYKYIAHGRKDKLTIKHVMGGFAVNTKFGPGAEARNFVARRKK